MLGHVFIGKGMDGADHERAERSAGADARAEARGATRAVAAALAAILLIAGHARADAPPIVPGPWNYGTLIGLNFTQSSFTSNWSGGDKGAFAWTFNSDVTAERQFNERMNVSNMLQLAYGQTANQERTPGGTLIWDPPDKTTDLILFESVLRYTNERYPDPYFSVRFESQFNDQSNPLGSISFNPLKLKEAVGLAKVFRKTDEAELISRLGFGLRQVYAKSFEPSTLRKLSSNSNDGGFEFQTDVTEPMLDKKIIYKGQLLVFWSVFYSKSDELEDFDRRVTAGEGAIPPSPAHESVGDFWKEPDVSFQNTFTAGITKHLNVNLFAQLVYDKFDTKANVDPSLPLGDQTVEINKNVRKAGQFKQTLAIGITYKIL
jgi:hypothetical protein